MIRIYHGLKIVAVVIAFLGVVPGSASAARLQPSDLTYQGAFLLPTTDFFAATGELGWPMTSGMTFNPSGNGGAGSIFVIGRGGRVAEINTPTPKLSSLNTATVLQSNLDPFAYGAAGQNDATAGIAYMTARGSQTSPKLYFGSFEYYNVDVSDYNSLGWADTTLANTNTAGLWHVGPNTADQSSWSIGPKHGEYLFSVPQTWADAHIQGRSLITGRMREGGNSGGSKGPVLTAVAPWASGNPPAPGVALPATPLLSFSGVDWTSWRTLGDPDWTYFSSGDRVTGGAFIDRGGRSAVVLGMRHGTFDNCPVLPEFGSDGAHGGFCLPTNDPEYGTEPFCYGDGGVECPWGVTVTNNKGYANGPYFARLIFIDVADLESVAQGSRTPQSVSSYAIFDLMTNFGQPAGTVQDRTGSNDVVGVAYDDTTGKLYVGQSNGNDPNGHPNPAWPVIHVYQVNTSTDSTPPAAPTSLDVE